ncbi:type II citrate synthase [Vibrio galatheae]|uniref:Type II citrate synthase n=1 Tax=Vibrio galatheae TaxID=579748 RepID=A0A0F4NR84_9VIBR|nr:DUF1853 family protein [Vibrio galatheae]KJY85368.1 type II citrate synthase [Vibrio galatheae]
MHSLQRFYDWISTTPPLFEPKPPFEELSSLTCPPYIDEQYQGNPRLGFIYQHLCTQLLKASDNYSLLEEEIQINKANGQTLGAIDLILHNHELQRNEHWEVAIKFYLLHQGTWYGPNAHDQLDKKLDRMLSHQLKMSNASEFLQQYPEYDQLSEHVLIQGRLYTNPFSPETIPDECLGLKLNQSQISGHWCYQSQWQQIGEPLYELDKPLWAIGRQAFSQPLDKPEGRFVHAQTRSGQFWFVVPDNWPKG